MKHSSLTLLLIFASLLVVGQSQIKSKKLRIEATGILATYGYTRLEGTKPKGYSIFQNPYFGGKIALRINRKTEFIFGFASASTKMYTQSMEFPDLSRTGYVSDVIDLHSKQYSVGIKKFVGNGISPIGRYLEFGLLISKITAPSHTYTSTQNIPVFVNRIDNMYPSLRIGGGKRNMISKNIYFFREFTYSINSYSFIKNDTYFYSNRIYYSANGLTNFNFNIGLGILL